MVILLTVLLCGYFTSESQLAKPTSRQVALTFDDLLSSHANAASVIHQLIDGLSRDTIPAIGFVNEVKLYQAGKEVPERTRLLKDWLQAGLTLSNHSFSHVSIDGVSVEEYQQNVLKGEVITGRLLRQQGEKLRYYRHTQLRTGPTMAYKQQLEKFLKAHGYRIAPVTIDNDDYLFAEVYARAKGRNDTATMNRVVSSYIPYLDGVFKFYEQLSIELLSYEVKQTLLLHASELNADHLDKLVTMMKRRGYQFISLDQALRDSAYRLPDAQCQKGYSWLQRWILAKGQPLQEQPSVPSFISEMVRNFQPLAAPNSLPFLVSWLFLYLLLIQLLTLIV